MDIEGAEADTLIGAQKIIKDTSPLVAASVYHRFDDLWRIPWLLHTYSDQYRFFLRSYAKAGWELVVYAVPKKRLLVNI